MEYFTRSMSISIVLIFICGISVSPVWAASQAAYVDYGVFANLVNLAPALSDPVLATLTEEAQDLWADGQMRVPSDGVFLEGDFNQNGNNNLALLVKDGDRRHLLVAEATLADSSTRLLALIQLDQEDAIRWNGWAIKCGSLTFVAWEDNHFRLSHGLDALFAHEIEPTYQGLAQGWEWDSRSWKRVHLLDYVVQYRGPYQVGVIRPPDERQSDLTIRLRSQGREVFTWRGNANSAFLVREETLYYTEFSPIATGMALVAHDLAHDEQLWRSDLNGVGPTGHSGYRNWGAALRIRDDVIEVVGKESVGGYLEFVNRHTGETIGNKVFMDVD